MTIPINTILEVILTLIAVFMAIVFHEVAHGFVASKLGDPTARSAGRLSLNPLAHVDPVGTVLVPLVLGLVQILWPSMRVVFFGWAKPVPVNPSYFRNPFRGMLYVALAGPGANLALGLGVAAVVRLVLLAVPSMTDLSSGLGAKVVSAALFILAMFVTYCVVLALFNLIPIPPLDGSRILTYFLPPGGRRAMLALEQYGFIILIVLIYLHGLDFIFSGIEPLAGWLIGSKWAALAFGWYG